MTIQCQLDHAMSVNLSIRPRLCQSGPVCTKAQPQGPSSVRRVVQSPSRFSSLQYPTFETLVEKFAWRVGWCGGGSQWSSRGGGGWHTYPSAMHVQAAQPYGPRPLKSTGRHGYFLNSTCDVELNDMRQGHFLNLTWDRAIS